MTAPLRFDTLGLSEGLLAAVTRAGYTSPTPIQAAAIPPALTGRDLIGCAATGTGKTAAFSLPLVERLAGRRGTRALVLAPTRELAEQIAEVLHAFGGAKNVRTALVIGGLGMGNQQKELREGREVIIATPGRLIDHLEQRNVDLSGIEVLVLDEADRMLDMGFRPQLEKILKRVPKKRQTMLFSATMAGEVAEFARAHLHDPARVEIARSGTVASGATQRVFQVDQNEKTALLMALLEEVPGSTLVFARTKHRADKVAKNLARAGHKAARIHGDRTQGQRRNALEGFKDGSYRVLVATDIAARGLDIEEIAHVVNYDLPNVPEDYVHRVGRTARASARGRASSFCAPEEKPLLRDIEKLTRTPVPVAEVPRTSEIFQSELKAFAQRQQAPGPKQHNHGVSQRPSNKPPGRHARTHPKKHASGGQPAAHSPQARTTEATAGTKQHTGGGRSFGRRRNRR